MWTYFILTLYPGIVGGLFGTDSGSVSLFGYPQKLHKHVEKRLQASVNSIRGWSSWSNASSTDGFSAEIIKSDKSGRCTTHFRAALMKVWNVQGNQCLWKSNNSHTIISLHCLSLRIQLYNIVRYVFISMRAAHRQFCRLVHTHTHIFSYLHFPCGTWCIGISLMQHY